jgi:hypothetical protein
MKLSDFELKHLDDFAAQRERETVDNPFVHTPFGLNTDGNFVSGWTMSYMRAGLFFRSAGKMLFQNDDMILITVPETETGIRPLAADMPFGWDGKINSSTAELAVWWAFEITAGGEAEQFMRANHPVVIFSYMDSDGPGEITVQFNGEFWVITD